MANTIGNYSRKHIFIGIHIYARMKLCIPTGNGCSLVLISYLRRYITFVGISPFPSLQMHFQCHIYMIDGVVFATQYRDTRQTALSQTITVVWGAYLGAISAYLLQCKYIPSPTSDALLVSHLHDRWRDICNVVSRYTADGAVTNYYCVRGCRKAISVQRLNGFTNMSILTYSKYLSIILQRICG